MAVDRRTLTVLAVVALGVVALGLSAATLTTPEGSGQSPESRDPPPETRPEADGSNLPVPDLLWTLLLVVGGLALLASLVYVAVYDRRRLAGFLGILVVILVIGLLAQSLGFQPADPNVTGSGSPGGGSSPSEAGESERGAGGGSGQTDDSTAVAVPALLLGVAFLVLLLVSYLLVDRTVTGPGPTGTSETESEEPAALGEIAGRAADRIEAEGDQTAADNEVYRAWQEMTARLDIEGGETTTPREFETRATDAGMAADDVRELRRLFEEVRYGGASPTDDREQRAVTVLRRVESRYGEGR